MWSCDCTSPGEYKLRYCYEYISDALLFKPSSQPSGSALEGRVNQTLLSGKYGGAGIKQQVYGVLSVCSLQDIIEQQLVLLKQLRMKKLS